MCGVDFYMDVLWHTVRIVSAMIEFIMTIMFAVASAPLVVFLFMSLEDGQEVPCAMLEKNERMWEDKSR